QGCQPRREFCSLRCYQRIRDRSHVGTRCALSDNVFTSSRGDPRALGSPVEQEQAASTGLNRALNRTEQGADRTGTGLPATAPFFIPLPVPEARRPFPRGNAPGGGSVCAGGGRGAAFWSAAAGLYGQPPVRYTEPCWNTCCRDSSA